MSGKTAFQAVIDITPNQQTHLRVTTNLKGVQLALPKPYQKQADELHAFKLNAYFSDAQAPLIRMTYQDYLGLTFAFEKTNNQTRLARAQLHFGKDEYALQPQRGLYITGNVNSFTWEDWQPILTPYFSPQPKTPNNSQHKTESTLKKIDVQIDTLSGYKQTIKHAHVIVSQLAQQWKVVVSSDKVVGTLMLANDIWKGGIQASFAKLYLTSFGAKANTKDLNPERIIPLQANIDDFNYAGTTFGKTVFNINHIKYGINIDTLTIQNPLYQLTTHGSWIRNNNRDLSIFSGTLQTDQLGDLLHKENFTDHLAGTAGTASFTLSWPDSPSNFQTTDLQGEITCEYKNGTITGLDNATNEKIGFGKLINLFSLQTLTDRLTLNFDDLTKSGFKFNKMKGKMNIENGKLTTKNFYIDGPVAEIYMSGNIGLKAKNYDLLIRINPYFTSSLPIIATIAGGPLVGAATWAASKVVRYGIEKVIVYEYQVKGTWKDPVITKVKHRA
jgi:uncharacterized protein YhdP